jgi:hypothetical protein
MNPGVFLRAKKAGIIPAAVICLFWLKNISINRFLDSNIYKVKISATTPGIFLAVRSSTKHTN